MSGLFLLTAAVFVILEMGLPTNFEMFAIGMGFVSLAIMTYMGVPVVVQVVVFTLVVFSIVVIAYRFSRREDGPPPEAFTPEALKGKTARVVSVDERGYVVKVNGEEWRAESEDVLSVGEEVVVLDVVGVRLKVKRR